MSHGNRDRSGDLSVAALQNLAAQPLLTPEQERELLLVFWQAKTGLAEQLLNQFPALRPFRPHPEPLPLSRFLSQQCHTAPPRHKRDLHQLHHRYLASRHRLICSNIRLAAHVARKFTHHRLDYPDLLAEAIIGLIQAVDRFQVTRGTRLATYATWWIRQTLQQAVATQSHAVALSPHHLQELGRLQGQIERLSHAHQYHCPLEEVGPPVAHQQQRLRQLQRATRPVTSVDTPHGNEDFCLLDTLPEPDLPPDPPDSVALRTLITRLLTELTRRERRVLIMTFGLDGKGERTPAAIARHLKLRPESIGEIRRRGLRKLQACAAKENLELADIMAG
jgi:RNA polymerase sigma factor (sigma-70 family)